jgi:multidrug efflux pump
MNLSEPFVRRPIGTILLTIGVALAGIGAFFNLPVSPLPQVDFPTISVQAQLAGASPETMASTATSMAPRATSRPPSTRPASICRRRCAPTRPIAR